MAIDERNSNRIVDQKWAEIFEDYHIFDNIERHGCFHITSAEINKYKEARLMTKFDYITSLPDIFHYNKLAILPTKRGEYVIGHFNAYHKMQTRDRTLLKDRKEIRFPSWVETIDPKNITSESTMLNAAAASGMIQQVFDVCSEELASTVNGRMSSNNFSFNINGLGNTADESYEIDVQNSQVEIDGGFETPDKLILFEAKNNATDSFLIRQLYYPYQLWQKKVNKEVIPVFLQYANDTFNFSVFRFDEIENYSSLKLVKRYNYIFGDETTSLDDIVNVFHHTKEEKEPEGIPIPQADSFNKVLGVLESIRDSKNGIVTNEELTLENDYVMRQANYYTSAGMYLELIEKVPGGGYSLSPKGKIYLNKNRKDRNLFISELLFKHKPIRLVFERGLNRGKPLTKDEAFALLEKNKDSENAIRLESNTRKRRCGTVASWVRYLFNLVDDH